MRKLISTLIMLVLLMSCAVAEETDNTIIGGADAPTSIFLTKTNEAACGSIILPFKANITTGYQWTAFVIGGDSVEIDEENSGYVSDQNPDFKDGVGGTHYFKLNALKPGESMIRFTYSRGLDDIADDTYMLIVVEDDLLMYAMDITEVGVYDGTVAEVNAEDHSVMLSTARTGEVIAWSSISSDEAREIANGYEYTYNGEGFGSDFKIIFYEDGIFTYCEGALSSYIGYGNWREEDNVVVLTDICMGPDSPMINQFCIADDKLIWIKEGSDNFIYIKLQDGAIFIPSEERLKLW